MILPRVDHALIHTVEDYSSVYVFFDPQEKGYHINKNNLITSTNWVFHIDNRLNLSQFAEVVSLMQERRSQPNLHARADSRIYVSVTDTSLSSLGFVDITSLRYRELQDLRQQSTVEVLSLQEMNYQGERMTFEGFVSDFYTQGMLWVFPRDFTLDNFLNWYEKMLQRGIIVKEFCVK